MQQIIKNSELRKHLIKLRNESETKTQVIKWGAIL